MFGDAKTTQRHPSNACGRRGSLHRWLTTWVPDVQSAWQILLQCAGHRCHHFLRTLPPSQSTNYAIGHDLGMQTAMASLLGEIPGCDDEKEDARRLATLPMRVGGLGLRSATRMAPGAFGASWADVLPMVHERLPTVAHGALEGEDALQSCLGELQLAARSLDRHGFISRPQWRALQSGARPNRANDIEPGEWAHGWQHHETSASEHHFRESVVLAHSCPSHQAHLRSHSWQRVFARVVAPPNSSFASIQIFSAC